MKALYIVTALLILLLFYLYLQISLFKIRKQVFYSNKIKKDYKILQLTDIHANPFLDYKKIIVSIKKDEPDLICITGDIIKKDSKELDCLKDFFNNLTSLKIPVYFIYGNHDLRHKSRKKIEYFSKNYSIKILKDEQEIFQEDFCINGYDHKNSLAHLEEKEGIFTLSLIHDPILFIRSKEKCDLVLSGHTHGGQVRFPFLGALYVPNQSFPPKYSKGLYYTEKGAVYIDSGLGYSLLPLRFLNPVQITYIELKKQYRA